MFVKNNKGFTLVEILLSIVLIGIIAIYIFPVFSHVFSSIFSSGDKTISTFEGQSNLVDIISEVNNGINDNITSNQNLTFEDIEIDSFYIEEIFSYQKPNNIFTGSDNLNYYIYSDTVSP